MIGPCRVHDWLKKNKGGLVKPARPYFHFEMEIRLKKLHIIQNLHYALHGVG
jgi:hypothetical protein